MTAWGLPHIVVDGDRRKILELRAQGMEAVFGDASAPGILHAAELNRRGCLSSLRRIRIRPPADRNRAQGQPSDDIGGAHPQ